MTIEKLLETKNDRHRVNIGLTLEDKDAYAFKLASTVLRPENPKAFAEEIFYRGLEDVLVHAVGVIDNQ